MLKVYGMSSSGNCYKIKLLLEQLARPYAWEEMDIMQGSTRSADFLAMYTRSLVLGRAGNLFCR